MVWHGKGKFGFHTGRTLRSHPTKKYFYGSCTSKPHHEYAVVKELKFTDPIKRLSFDKNSVKLGVNDGELSLGDGPKQSVIYSLNKHKRWLLPDLVKEDVEQLYWDEICESEHDSRLKNPCKRARQEEAHTQAHKLRVAVVERHASSNISRGQPDCIGVTSSSPCTQNLPKPQRKPRQKHAHVGDLKTKGEGSSGDYVEVCYEFLSPFPKKSWPLNRQHGQLNTRWFDELKGTKSRKKCKGRRNKGYRHPNLERDSSSLSNAVNDEVDNEESTNYFGRTCYFPLGAYIDDMLKLGYNNQERPCIPVNTNTNKTLPKSPVLYGKGDAIYVEKEDQVTSCLDKIVNNQTTTKFEPLIVDRKVKFNLLVEDIAPDNLLQQFGNNYIEDDIFPRKFIIKADLNKSLPGTYSDLEECSVLFEVADTLCSFVEADVAFLVPNDDVLPHNLVDILESDLNSWSTVEPLTVKAVVEHTTEKIISEVVHMPRKTCSKKTDQNIARFPVEFIHNVCERKPEICGMRDATRFSMESNTDPKECHLPSKYVHNDERHELCCQICFVKEDEQLGTDFTSLLRCSHRFCNHCWTMYITSCIDFGQSRITCPHFGCKTVIGEPIVWSRTNSEIYRRYMKLKCEVAIDTNQQFRHCPAANCTNIAYISSSTKKQSSLAVPILCKCGRIWCFHCQKDAHWPASCEEAESFRKKCDDNESLKKTYLLPGHISSVQVKRCPFCSHPIEKSVGCQHMSCRCGNEFCWECLSPWDGHNWDKCDESRKDLEDVVLAFDFGNARFNKYSKIALDNFLERSGKRLTIFRRMMKRAKRLDDVNKLVSFDLETPANRRFRRYAEKSLGTFVEQIFNFKHLAHLVLENTAAALAVTKTKNLLKSLDRNMRILNFIVQRLNEIFSKPEVLSDEENLENAKLLLFQGEQLIRSIHVYTRARRHNLHVH